MIPRPAESHPGYSYQMAPAPTYVLQRHNTQRATNASPTLGPTQFLPAAVPSFIPGQTQNFPAPHTQPHNIRLLQPVRPPACILKADEAQSPSTPPERTCHQQAQKPTALKVSAQVFVPKTKEVRASAPQSNAQLNKADIIKCINRLKGIKNPSLQDVMQWSRKINDVFSSAKGNDLCDQEVLAQYFDILVKNAKNHKRLLLELQMNARSGENILRNWYFRVQKLMEEDKIDSDFLSTILLEHAQLDMAMPKSFQFHWNNTIIAKLLKNEFHGWSFANLILHSALLRTSLTNDYLDAWYSCALDRVAHRELDQECLAKIYYGFSLMGIRIPEPLGSQLNRAIDDNLKSHSFTHENLCHLLRSAVLLDEKPSENLLEHIIYSLRQEPDDRFLYLAYITLKNFNMSNACPEASELKRRIDGWKSRKKWSTDLSTSLGHALEVYGNKVKAMAWIDPILGRVDFLISEQKLIFMTHEPGHFMGDGQTYKPKHDFQRKLLQNAGYTVIDVDYFAWAELGTLEKWRAYLKKEIDGVNQPE